MSRPKFSDKDHMQSVDLNLLDKSFRKLHRLSSENNHIWVVENLDNSEHYVLKFFNQRKRFALKEILLGKEVNKSMALMKLLPIDQCEIPQIIATDRRSYLIMNLLSGKYLKCAANIDSGTIAKGLFNFNRCSIKIDRLSTTVATVIGMLNISILLGVARLFRRGDVIHGVSLFKRFISLLLSTKKNRDYATIHSDLVNHENSFVNDFGEISLIDFENLKIENRWILTDILDLSIDYNLTCRFDLINEYLRQDNINISKEEFKYHVWFSLLRRSLNPARHYPEDVVSKLKFMTSEKVKFNSWYNKYFLGGLRFS